ncbi:MAG: YigZ family protein [Propionibacteriaceae bacterium]|nr:YigZ family protein [Propionibacteriaceae bacterium]
MSPALRPAAGWRAEGVSEIKRSRFLTLVARADSEAEARDWFAQWRQRHPDARHHCTALIVEAGAGPPTRRSSDDGEPPGSAGGPMLAALEGSGLVNLAAVVARHFGGVKLGVGGLVRAYGEAVATLVAQAPRVELTQREVWRVELDHAQAGRLIGQLTRRGAVLLDQSFGADRVELELMIPPQADPAALLAQLTQGAPARRIGRRTVELPLP